MVKIQLDGIVLRSEPISGIAVYQNNWHYNGDPDLAKGTY